MSTQEMYVYLSSDSSLQYHKGNSPSNFTSYLPQKLIFDGEWEVGLVQILFPQSDKSMHVNILSNVVCDSLYENNMLPILRWMNLSRKGKFVTIDHPLYISVCKDHVDNISICIKNLTGEVHSFKVNEPVRCVLHFRKCQLKLRR